MMDARLQHHTDRVVQNAPFVKLARMGSGIPQTSQGNGRERPTPAKTRCARMPTSVSMVPRILLRLALPRLVDVARCRERRQMRVQSL